MWLGNFIKRSLSNILLFQLAVSRKKVATKTILPQWNIQNVENTFKLQKVVIIDNNQLTAMFSKICIHSNQAAAWDVKSRTWKNMDFLIWLNRLRPEWPDWSRSFNVFGRPIPDITVLIYANGSRRSQNLKYPADEKYIRVMCTCDRLSLCVLGISFFDPRRMVLRYIRMQCYHVDLHCSDP